MNRLTIMGASIALLLAAFVLTPAEAYHKRHHQRHHYAYSYRQAPDHFVLNQSDRRARHQHAYSARRVAGHSAENCTMTNEGRRVCMGAASQATMAAVPDVPVVDAAGNRAYAMADAAQIIGSRSGARATARTHTVAAACANISGSTTSGSTSPPTGRGCSRVSPGRAPGLPPSAAAT